MVKYVRTHIEDMAEKIPAVSALLIDDKCPMSSMPDFPLAVESLGKISCNC
jgi:hypothetical protein